MNRKIMNYMENIAVYLARRSVGKSVPWYMYKVQKPETLEKMLKEIEKENPKFK